MLDNIYGVPTHALVVHAVVVLLPMAALTGVAVALVPALRRRYGVVVLLLTLAAVGSVPIAERTGSRLFDRQSARFGPADVTEAGLMERHADLAEELLPWALALLAGVALAVLPPLLARRSAGARRSAAGSVPAAVGGGAAPLPERGEPRAGAAGAAAPAWTKPVALLAAVVTLVGATVSLILVIRIGHLGSEAAWERVDRPASMAPPLR
ncbi:MAG TPA: hypothetical protein VE547_17390 [Mycobacteriales bacterium]|nr:hypothetical protein [Mycobacteriales bacterium]